MIRKTRIRFGKCVGGWKFQLLSFYHWRTRPQSATAERRQVLTMRIKGFFKASDGTYGYRRIHADLVAAAIQCSPELVRQIMRQEELIPLPMLQERSLLVTSPTFTLGKVSSTWPP